jgi:hypothetical protein
VSLKPPIDPTSTFVSDTASVQKVTFNKGNGISDLTVVNPTPNSNQQNAVEFAICLDPHVSNVQFESIDSAGVLLTGTFGGDIDGCKFTDQPDRVNFATPEFGYGIDARNATENLTVRGIVGRRLRHLFTTTTHHSGTSTVYGIPRAITVQGIATEMLGPAFDTHPAAEDVIFHGCVVNGCTHTGYNLRGQNNKVMSSSASWCADGAWISGPAHGSEIRNSSFKHLGGWYTSTARTPARPAAAATACKWIASADGSARGRHHLQATCFAHMLRAGSVRRVGVPRQPGPHPAQSGHQPGQLGSLGDGVKFTSNVSDIIDTVIARNAFLDYSVTGSERRTSGALVNAVQVDEPHLHRHGNGARGTGLHDLNRPAGVLVNRAYQRLVGLHRWPFREASGEGTAPLDVTDLGQIEAVTNETQQYPLELVSYDDLLEWYGDLTTTGNPAYAYRAFVDSIPVVATYPTNTDTIGVQYWKFPTDLSGVQVPIVPARYQLLIVEIASVMAERERGNHDAANALQVEVDRQVAEMVDDLLPQQEPAFQSISFASEDW